MTKRVKDLKASIEALQTEKSEILEVMPVLTDELDKLQERNVTLSHYVLNQGDESKREEFEDTGKELKVLRQRLGGYASRLTAIELQLEVAGDNLLMATRNAAVNKAKRIDTKLEKLKERFLSNLYQQAELLREMQALSSERQTWAGIANPPDEIQAEIDPRIRYSNVWRVIRNHLSPRVALLLGRIGKLNLSAMPTRQAREWLRELDENQERN